MKEDPIFKERFGISTPIRYTPNVVIDPKYSAIYERAWKKFKKETVHCGSVLRRNRFDSLLCRIEKLGDDLPFCKRVSICYIDKEVGYGVFAKEKIPPYSLLNHYAGFLTLDKTVPSTNDSTFTFSDFDAYSIDAKKTGNWGRFMNHSPEGDPKTNVIAWEHYSKWGPRIIFTASRHGIKKGEQLLYSYGDSYWDEDAFLDL